MTRAAINETRLWEWLKVAERHYPGRELHMERIENLVGVGNADVSGCLSERYFDIELKTAHRPAKADTVVISSKKEYVRPAQKVWHLRRWLAGGSNFVLLQIASGPEAERYLLPGLYIRDIEDKTEAQLYKMSVIGSREHASEIVKRAATYRSTLSKSLQEHA